MDQPSFASNRKLSVSSEYRAEIQPYYDDHRSSFGGSNGGSVYRDNNRLPPLGLQEPPPNYHHSQDHCDWNHNRDQGELVGRYHSSFWGREEEHFHPSDVRFANDTYRFCHDGYQPYSEYHRRPSDVPCRGCGRINCTCTQLPPNPSYRHDDYHHSNGYG